MDIQAVLNDIAEQAAKGEIIFSTHAEMAWRVQREADNPECSIEHISKLVSAEPLLAAKTISTANSVAFNPGGRAISEIKTAISRLGFSALRALATSIVVRQISAAAPSPEQKSLSAKLWEHTAHVAALARVIARHVTRKNPDAAFLSGIVHEIGGFFLISCSNKYPGLLTGDLEFWRSGGEAQIGQSLLGALELPTEIPEALETLWSGYLALPPNTLGDTLLLADELCPTESPLNTSADNKHRCLPAELDLIIDNELLSQILTESADEVASLTSILKL